jgi:hypothetical protein
MNWRRNVGFDLDTVTTVGVQERASLEGSIDHRALGWGTHNGAKRPNRRRVGTMLGRGVVGKQFWAVAASRETDPLLVLDLHDGEFRRAVMMVKDPGATAAEIRRTLGSI